MADVEIKIKLPEDILRMVSDRAEDDQPVAELISTLVTMIACARDGSTQSLGMLEEIVALGRREEKLRLGRATRGIVH